MIVYVVLCNGKISSEGYKTLAEAEMFCKNRGAKKITDRWMFTDNDDAYQIIDVCIKGGKI